jgi:hypothetical protein
MKRKLAKDATLDEVIKAVNEVKENIRFIRTDNAGMEDHLNNKIGLMETRLRHQAEVNHSEVMNKLEEISGHQQETKIDLEKIIAIHPKFSHAAI